jgi:hypothetical protein
MHCNASSDNIKYVISVLHQYQMLQTKKHDFQNMPKAHSMSLDLLSCHFKRFVLITVDGTDIAERKQDSQGHIPPTK